MLTLKIMSDKNCGDCEPEPDKNYRIIGGIKEIEFRRIYATKYERTMLDLADAPEGKEWIVCLAECSFPDIPISSNYLLTGHCYILNDQGQTVDTYWPRPKLVDKK